MTTIRTIHRRALGALLAVAAQLGAHLIKVKLPTAHIEQEEARKAYERSLVRAPELTEARDSLETLR